MKKIWKGEYVEIFSLLPLEKFNLDRVKADKSKKEDEKKHHYRVISRTSPNWLQAFAILASVISKKEPEKCSALFCYLDVIGEAHRVYCGMAWLRYDEQVCQHKAIQPSIQWDHKDISLWMRLMTFQGGGALFLQPRDPRPTKQRVIVGSLIRAPADSGLPVNSNTSVPDVGVVTLFLAASGPGEDTSVTPLEKGRTLVMVLWLLPFLNRYPDRTAARILELGFFVRVFIYHAHLEKFHLLPIT